MSATSGASSDQPAERRDRRLDPAVSASPAAAPGRATPPPARSVPGSPRRPSPSTPPRRCARRERRPEEVAVPASPIIDQVRQRGVATDLAEDVVPPRRPAAFSPCDLVAPRQRARFWRRRELHADRVLDRSQTTPREDVGDHQRAARRRPRPPARAPVPSRARGRPADTATAGPQQHASAGAVGRTSPWRG